MKGLAVAIVIAAALLAGGIVFAAASASGSADSKTRTVKIQYRNCDKSGGLFQLGSRSSC